MTAIYGLLGRSDPEGLAVIGHRLSHRGARALEWAPAPAVQLGWRLPPGEGGEGIPEVPLVFTGTLTNRDELAALLGLPSLPPSTRADAALLWALYAALGAAAFARINGQFALAMLDPDTRGLLLAADRWVTCPLYVARAADRWAFASEYKALLALPDVPARVARAAVSCVQATKYLPTAQGLLAEVRPVAPGEYLRIGTRGCKATSYPQLKLEVPRPCSEQALAVELRGALLRAARRATAGLDRVGIALSAGLDSTVTLGAVRAVAPDMPIHTYTASFDRDDPDLALAAEAAHHFGAVHREMLIAPEDLPALLPELVWRMEDPICREEMLVYHVLAQEAAPEVPVVLYGHLADMLFGGMPRHLLIRAAGRLRQLSRPLMEFYDYTQAGVPPRSLLGRLLVAGYYRGRSVPPPAVADAAASADGKRLILAPDEPLNAALLAGIATPTEAAAMERLHAWAGVKLGSLFYDREVAACAFRVPDRLKIRGIVRKYILRHAARGFLPPKLAARPKGMIRIARNQRLVQVVEAMADDLLSPGAVRGRGLFDPADIARLRRPSNGGYTMEQFYHLWTLLLLELWCRSFIDARGARPAAAADRARAEAGRKHGTDEWLPGVVRLPLAARTSPGPRAER